MSTISTQSTKYIPKRWTRNTRTTRKNNNMYNSIYRKSEAETRRSGISRINIIRKKATNARVTQCKTKCQSDEASKLGACVVTNTTIGVKDCTYQKDGITRYHYIRPCELAVDILQYAVNTHKAKLIHDEHGDYLAFENFPTLQIETVDEGTYKDTRREGFYNALEDASTLTKIPYEEQLLQYLTTNTYYNAIKILDPTSNTYIDTVSKQDITYVRNIANSLLESCDFYPAPAEIKITRPEQLKYDLADLDLKYIILESLMLASPIQKTEEYLICGYPDKSKMTNSLTIRTNPEINKALSDIYNTHKTIFARLFAEMHNQTIPRDKPEQMINLTSLENLDKPDFRDKLELYKFMKSINITYFEDWVKQNEQLDPFNPNAWINSSDFTSKIEFMKAYGLEDYARYIEDEIAKTCLTPDERTIQLANIDKVKHAYKTYVNELLLEYLNKPMTRIRYHFLIYRIDRSASNGNTSKLTLLPVVFNIKQLESRHKPLLEKVLDLIQTRLPAIFGILEGSRNGLDRYKLFHSYVNYGDYFYVSTEYLHTMSNISHYAYKYENSMELEELIYSLSSTPTVSGNPFWQELKITYQLKTFRVTLSQPITELQDNNNRANSTIGNNRTARNIKRTMRQNKTSSSNTLDEYLNGTIMMIYEKSYQQYVIIYKDLNDNIFKLLEVKSNLASLKKDMLEQIRILNQQPHSESKDKSIVRYVNYQGNIFRVIRARRFTKEDMQLIKKNNPLIAKIIKKPFSEKTISIKNMIKTQLLDNGFLEDLQVVNVAYYKPIIYFNCIMNQEYLSALLNYKNTGYSKNPRKQFKDIGNFSDIYGIYGDTNTLVNPFNCGYNIVEVGDNHRKVIWILPFSKESEYLRNFTSLNNNHILLLETIKKLYLERGNLCFVHIQSTHIYGTLHFHITNYDDYNSRKYPTEIQGSSIIKEINISQLINVILLNPNYYNNYNINLLNLTI